MLEQKYSGSRTIAAQSAPWWFSPLPAIAPKTLEIQTETVEVERDHGIDDDWDFPYTLFPDGGVSDAANEFYWVNLTEGDRNYLTGPRDLPKPCVWCGGRLRHHRLCDELQASWEPSLP